MADVKRIDQMYAFVAIDPQDNTEGVISIEEGGTIFPLVGADMERVEQLRPLALGIAELYKTSVMLLRFSTREEVEQLGG